MIWAKNLIYAFNMDKNKKINNIIQNFRTTHTLIIGKPGSGKSVLLKSLHLANKCLAISKYNSIAAVNGGETIDSFIKRVTQAKDAQLSLLEADILIIDDIDLLSSLDYERINNALQKLKNNRLPFGDMVIIATCSIYNARYILDKSLQHNTLHSINFEVIDLKTESRQKSNILGEIIERASTSLLTHSDIELLNTRVISAHQDTETTKTIITNNHKSELINNNFIFRYKCSELHCFRAEFTKNFLWVPTPCCIRVAEESPIIYVNDLSSNSLTTITSITTNSTTGEPEILTNNHHKIKKYKWEIKHSKAFYYQFPIYAAHSLSYAQCYGRTIKMALIDTQVNAMTLYRVLSQFQSLDDLYLERKLTTKDLACSNVIRIYNSQQSEKVKNFKKEHVKIIFFSDLHLEFESEFSIKNINADILILAGDICPLAESYYSVLEQKIFKYWGNKPIIWIFGNHEYYTQNIMIDIEENFLAWVTINYPNVHILNNSSTKILGVEIFGGTMWTDFYHSNQFIMDKARISLGDFSSINVSKTEKLTPEYSVELHKEFSSALAKWMKTTNQPKIVVTHHCPLKPTSGNLLSYAFYSTDMEHVIQEQQPLVWIYGHTHSNYTHKIGGTIVTSNQHGYPLNAKYPSCKGFNTKGKVILVSQDNIHITNCV